MGPLLLTGLVCLGGSVALGLLTSNMPRLGVNSERDTRVRGLFAVQAAFINGMAILGVVVGLLAVDLGHPVGGFLAAGPAAAGAIIGVAIALDAGGLDRRASSLGLSFIAGLGVLGVVAGLIATLVDGPGATSVVDWPFVVLGLIGGASALGVGLTGGVALRATEGVDADAVKSIQIAQLTRCLWLLIAGDGAVGIAIALLLLGG
jgi:F0F1-type ATP synthase membrane subunit c/vacuolar-type H+-ATPase subunit K